MRGLADISDRYGSGTIRLTVWQNLLISDISEADIAAVIRALKRWVELRCNAISGALWPAPATKAAASPHPIPKVTPARLSSSGTTHRFRSADQYSLDGLPTFVRAALHR
jgi:hypothetical protein